MNAWMWSFLALSFLLGSIPFGLILGRFFAGRDVRLEGSKNIGATNVSRVLGFWPAGFLTFLLDALKVSSLLLVLRMYGPEPLSGVYLWSLAFVGLMGHCYSPWLKFRGGKGVAPFFGVLAVLAPVTALISGVLYGIGLWITGVGALGSLIGIFLGMAVHVILSGVGDYFYIYVLCTVLILVRHESNLADILIKNGYPDA